MPSKDNSVSNKNKTKEISVKTVNKPTKKEGTKKIKELSEFLSKTWHLPFNSE